MCFWIVNAVIKEQKPTGGGGGSLSLPLSIFELGDYLAIFCQSGLFLCSLRIFCYFLRKIASDFSKKFTKKH